jgi:hypothetical protein
MILIFCGFDRSGKSTLAKIVQKQYFFEYYRSTHQRDKSIDLESAIAHDWRFFFDIAKQINLDSIMDIIFDRSFIDQYIYSKIFRKENICRHYNSFFLYEKIFKEYCDILQKMDHRIIFCIRENYKEGEMDEELDLSIYKTVNKEFIYFFDKIGYNLNMIECKFEDGIEYNFKKICKEIE